MSKNFLREAAKKEYKKLIKDMPKKKRPTFRAAFPIIKQQLARNSSPISNIASTVSKADEELLDDFIVNLDDEVIID